MSSLRSKLGKGLWKLMPAKKVYYRYDVGMVNKDGETPKMAKYKKNKEKIERLKRQGHIY